MKYLSDETIALMLKVLPPALIAMSISTAIKMKRERITVFNALSSMVIGVGTAWLLSSFIVSIEDERWHVPLIALIAICGEKIAEYAVYKFKIEIIITAFIDTLYEKIKGKK